MLSVQFICMLLKFLNNFIGKDISVNKHFYNFHIEACIWKIIDFHFFIF